MDSLNNKAQMIKSLTHKFQFPTLSSIKQSTTTKMEAVQRRQYLGAARGQRMKRMETTLETIKEIRSPRERVVEATKMWKKSVKKWWKNNGENKRKGGRVAKYKLYDLNSSKLKISINNGFKWMKNNKC
ncbi:hypothetical protein Csa_007529 [Cucumis sativus]|uniref:Uncharacterized protein n=1 Tax=Cucumis sativus TaxID=3659 RepID=A0A0A0LYX3_CUCSA|nr:hypothetical protein Csa_007529 [Cucumis sativus]